MTANEAIALIKNEMQCVLTWRNCKRDCEHCPLIKPEGDIKEAFEMAIKALKLPEREKGEWIINEEEKSTVSGSCSACGWQAHLYEDDVVGMNFCPNCGAKMDGGKAEYGEAYWREDNE